MVELASATRSEHLVITLREEAGDVVLDCRSDGRLTAATDPSGPTSYRIVRGLQRELEAVGVRVELDNDGSWFSVRLRDRTTSMAAGSVL